jgi:hypothetical protein
MDSDGAVRVSVRALSASVVRAIEKRGGAITSAVRRVERAYGEKKEIASELTIHFTEGRDYRRAVQYSTRWQAALRRSAYSEATPIAIRLELKSLPDTPEQQRQELALRMILRLC